MKSPIDMNEAEMRRRFDFSKPTRGRFHGLYREDSPVILLDHDPDAKEEEVDDSFQPTTRELGKQIFESHVRAAGLRLRAASKPRGIDYFLYGEGEDNRESASYSVKVRTSIHEVFALYKRDAHIPRLLLAYVWHVKQRDSSVYALSYEEALRIVRNKPYMTSESWKVEGGYSVTHAPWDIKKMLEPYRMTRERWQRTLQLA